MPPWGTCSRRWGTGRATEWTGIVVDGRFLQAYLALAESGLHDGAVVRPGAGCPPALVDPVRGPVLAVVGGVDAGRRFGLRPGRTLIGRGDVCDVTLASSTVSVQHCAVDVDPLGEVVVADLGSRNGTRIGSEIVRDRRKVAPGEIMLLGAVQLMLCDPERNDRRRCSVRSAPQAGTSRSTGHRGPCRLRTPQRRRCPSHRVSRRPGSPSPGPRCLRRSRWPR